MVPLSLLIWKTTLLNAQIELLTVVWFPSATGCAVTTLSRTLPMRGQKIIFEAGKLTLNHVFAMVIVDNKCSINSEPLPH